MAQVHGPPLPSPGLETVGRDDYMASQQLHAQPIHLVAPTLSQDFVFPWAHTPQPAAETSPTHARKPIAQRRSLPQRARPSHLPLHTLPPFDFGTPAADGSAMGPGRSPSRSPSRLTPPFAHPTGHKRGASEFIGGDITHGGPVLLSSTGVSKDAGSAEPAPVVAPASPPKGPPTSRRGHKHRRSGAVSQSDIRFIVPPPGTPKGGSAPSTPSDPFFRPHMLQEIDKMPSLPNLATTETVAGESTPPVPELPTPSSSLSRVRVGFSDHVEYIPRPLSTISSETSSSVSTIRAGHSVTDSISSVVASVQSSPSASRELNLGTTSFSDRYPRSRITDDDILKQSARAAEARSGRSQRRSRSNPHLISQNSIPPSSASSDDLSTPKTRVDRPTGGDIPRLEPLQSDATFGTLSQKRPTSLGPQTSRPRTSPDGQAVKQPHRMRSWAGSILHWKERQTDTDVVEQTAREEASPAIAQASAEPEFSLDDINFDTDTTCIIESPGSQPVPVAALPDSEQQIRTKQTIPSREPEQPSSMIDIDAALDFADEHDTEIVGPPSGSKRRLHSSGETGGFSGPGMHYHRRAESAPEMEPFERPHYGFQRMGSNSAMDEAIVEEEEEEAAQQDEISVAADTSETSSGVESVVDESVGSASRRRPTPRQLAYLMQQDGTSPQTHPAAEDDMTFEIVGADEEPRFSVLTKSSDDSTITPTLSHDPLGARSVSGPMDFTLPTPPLTIGTDTETPSATSSADYAKTSFDALEMCRVHTASSSINDRITINSSKMGGQAASSVDDVPSLTGSASSMTSGHPSRFSSSAYTIDSNERSASVSTMPHSKRPGSSRKRASLASLSGLMGGMYNKSKLNIAETLTPDSPEKSDVKKRHRISRMMTFWKSKERLSVP